MVIIILFLFAVISTAQQTKTDFAENWEYIGIAVEKPEYTIWYY